MKLSYASIPAAVLILAASSASAQQQPDAGLTLQENAPRAVPAPKATMPLPAAPAPVEAALPGGARVVVHQVSVSGNTIFSTEKLLSQLGDYRDRDYDFAGLTDLATKLAAYYRQNGYPFASAYLPPQALADGKLRIMIVEGRYGQVQATGNPQLKDQAQHFLAILVPGEPISSPALERATLLLNDQPGVKIVPVLRPGSESGTGDLLVDVQRDRRVTGEVGLDNYGNRYTGRDRGTLNVDVDSPFTLGDQIALRSLVTDEKLWFGSAAYALPLGASGLRGKVGLVHSYYYLGSNFSALDATGTADVATLGLSYAVVRSQNSNVSVSATFQHKQLHDKQGAVDSSTRRASDSIPVEMDFDVRDTLVGGGLTYGAVTWTPGHLRLSDEMYSLDANTARTAGRYSKVNVDVARIQSLVRHLDLYGRFAAQWTRDNLDSSEKFGLGGINGVRAYPSGEGYGDKGWLAQLELRYTLGAFVPYAFYDAGSVALNASPWQAGANHRSIGGAGLGVRYLRGRWSANSTIAWHVKGGAPTSDTRDSIPVAWASVSYRF
ncbi:Polymerase [Burkholderia sp. 8Y]|uniref:ShlB/FhaC/HecB family hemolysin secretion/activation protein n=1 Tax=Burkholderia sp. 8Y TaxID=2653133 RepID=UPI0012F2B0F7|nr:ShlB/FhaC/HecB family hemolysin secretion/activation protein [Burkholderia sp. 8Y]VXB57712.1 Polymerase [Burkholderia sp. 8Y]